MEIYFSWFRFPGLLDGGQEMKERKEDECDKF